MKVAFIITHPIQYYVPLLRGLNENDNLELKVFYTWGKDSIIKFDPSYNKVIEWDIPLLDGYNFEFLDNVSPNPGSSHFYGIDNPDIINKLLEFCPDKIVVYGWNYKSHLKVLKYFKNKVELLFRGDSHLLNNKFNLKTLLRKLYLCYIYSNIDFAISVGTNNKLYYKWVGLKDNQILFAPHSVDNNYFDNINVNYEDSIKSSLGIPEDHIVFLYCGSFEKRKRVFDLIHAMALLKKHKCSLIIVGAGGDELLLKELKIKLDCNNVYFTGFVNQSELPIIYASSDILVLPSDVETWGLVINEAMASGLAIIASNKVGAAIDLVTNNGFIYESGNIYELKKMMKTLIDNTTILDDFKLKSKINIQLWSMQNQIKIFSEILQRN